MRWIVRVPVSEDSFKHLLRQVITKTLVVRESKEETIDLPLVPLEQDRQGVQFALLYFVHQLFVGHSGCLLSYEDLFHPDSRVCDLQGDTTLLSDGYKENKKS